MRQAALFIWAGLCVAVTVSSANAGDFEGILHMSTSHGTEPPHKMDWSIKGDKARIDRPRENGRSHGMIIDTTAKKMLMLFDEKHSYAEIDFGGERGERLDKMMDTYDVERTGKTDIVAGYSCEIWRIKEKDAQQQRTEACIAKGFGRVASFWVEPRKSQPAWITELVNDGAMAIRSVRYDKAGSEISRMEVTSVARKSLDSGLFAAPHGYTKMDMGPMFGGDAGGEDVRKKMEEMKKRRAGQGGFSGGGEQSDMGEMMKQFGEMMKKKQQGGQ